MQTVRVSLAPSPGFCIKTAALKPALCNLTPPPPSPGKLDVPTAALATLAVPQGLKIFVNIAWDRNVPPPPHGSDEVIQKAMLGDDDADADNDGGWFVPVVVSEPREDRDKGASCPPPAAAAHPFLCRLRLTRSVSCQPGSRLPCSTASTTPR